MLSRYIIGAYVSWQTLSWICIAVPVSFLIFIHAIPETPRCLISMGKREKAVKSLMWYRGVENAEFVSDEMAVVSIIVN